jgi:hypothetical protein
VLPLPLVLPEVQLLLVPPEVLLHLELQLHPMFRLTLNFQMFLMNPKTLKFRYYHWFLMNLMFLKFHLNLKFLTNLMYR